ncbi:MAG: DUF427 domain-containing protein [Pseudomonadota bacterium]
MADLRPYPHHVRITAQGQTLAQTTSGVLHRHGYAPDIYLPRADAIAAHPAMRSGAPVDPSLADHVTFDFDSVETYVDGALVRGHVRDPLKVITVHPVSERLEVMVDGAPLVDTHAALELLETGLPPRFYVPPGDVDQTRLVPSERVSVCTYKGDAAYHHVQTQHGMLENAVWTYAAPWTDFAQDIGRIAGHLGLYTSVMDAVLLNGVPRDAAAEADADAAMIANPTVDQTLKARPSLVRTDRRR